MYLQLCGGRGKAWRRGGGEFPRPLTSVSHLWPARKHQSCFFARTLIWVALASTQKSARLLLHCSCHLILMIIVWRWRIFILICTDVFYVWVLNEEKCLVLCFTFFTIWSKWPQWVEVKQTLQQTAKTDFDGCVFEIMNQSPDELCADGLTKCLADLIQIGDRGTRH